MTFCATCRFMAASRDGDGLTFYVSELDVGEDDGERGSKHATCTRIIHGNGDAGRGDPLGTIGSIAVVVDGSGYAARLLVLPTFGCVLHEPKR